MFARLWDDLYTVLTVVIASACLYLFACEPLQMFALAILLGLVSGAYSSIFMSSVVWLSIRARVTARGAFNPGTKPYLATQGFLAPMGMIAVVGIGGISRIHESDAHASHTARSCR